MREVMEPHAVLIRARGLSTISRLLSSCERRLPGRWITEEDQKEMLSASIEISHPEGFVVTDTLS